MADQGGVVLFEKDSPEDLVLRGFGRDEIMVKTGTDVGYHGNGYNSRLKGIDRYAYKLAYVTANFVRDEVLAVLDAYGKGLDKASVLGRLGVSAGSSNALFSLASFFRDLGYEAEFREADRAQRLHSMRTGTEAKYGTDNVFKLAEFQERAAETREKKYGARYTFCPESSLCDAARATFAEHMKDVAFAADLNARRRATNMAVRGVEVPMRSPEVLARARATSMARFGADCYAHSELYRERLPEMLAKQGKRLRVKTPDPEYDGMTTLGKYHLSNMRKYGVSHHSKTEEFKRNMSAYMKAHGEELRKKSDVTCMAKYGVPCYMQTDAFREGQSDRMRDPDYQERLLAARRRNGTVNSSAVELELGRFLVSIFGADDVQDQYRDSRYPFYCDFYIRSRDLFIELNGTWGHGGHWFDGDYAFDIERVELWRSRAEKRRSYASALSVWQERDVMKRRAAADAGLNYLVFWSPDMSLDEARLWSAMGCPDARDWAREYSWLPGADTVFDDAVLSKCADDSRLRRAYAVWSDGRRCKRGTVQSLVYSVLYKRLGILPADVGPDEVLEGLSLAGFQLA